MKSEDISQQFIYIFTSSSLYPWNKIVEAILLFLPRLKIEHMEKLFTNFSAWTQAQTAADRVILQMGWVKWDPCFLDSKGPLPCLCLCSNPALQFRDMPSLFYACNKDGPIFKLRHSGITVLTDSFCEFLPISACSASVTPIHKEFLRGSWTWYFCQMLELNSSNSFVKPGCRVSSGHGSSDFAWPLICQLWL